MTNMIMPTRLATLALLAVGAGCGHVEVDADGNAAVGNLSPSRGTLEVPEVRQCCPREGGRLLLHALVNGAGDVVALDIERPPAWIGVLGGTVCTLGSCLGCVAGAFDDEGGAQSA